MRASGRWWWAIVVALLLAAGCSDDDSDASAADETTADQPGDGDGPAASTDETPDEPDFSICRESTPEDCRMVAVAFEPPSRFAEVSAIVSGWPGTLVGVWREDWTCIPGGAVAEGPEASRFAYRQADSVEERVTALAGPPITDGGRTFSLWDRRIEALDRVRLENPPIIGAAVWVPIGFDVATDSKIASAVDVPHRFAHGDGESTGVLYVGAPGYSVDPTHPDGLPFDEDPPSCV